MRAGHCLSLSIVVVIALSLSCHFRLILEMRAGHCAAPALVIVDDLQESGENALEEHSRLLAANLSSRQRRPS